MTTSGRTLQTVGSAEAVRGFPDACERVHRKPLHLREIDCQTRPLASRNSPAGRGVREPQAAALFVFFSSEVNAYQGSVTTGLLSGDDQQAVPHPIHTEFDVSATARSDISPIRHEVIVLVRAIGDADIQKLQVLP